MADAPKRVVPAEDVWRTYLTTGNMPSGIGAPWFMSRAMRPLARLLPASPRCQLCYYPFHGIGGVLAHHLFGIAPSKMNPQVCNLCERAAEAFPGGAEIETTLLFADVRGSTSLAEGMSSADYSRLIGRFYTAAQKALIGHSALMEKLIGDAVTAFFVPGMAGAEHARAAVEAGRAILRDTGHADPGGPWVPVGVGVHTGPAFIGSVQGETGLSDIVVLGDAANIAARLASLAGPGEILISEAARVHAGLEKEGLDTRRLQLKGRSEPVDAWALRVGPEG